MEAKYNEEMDVLYITLSDDPIAEGDEQKPGVIIDYSSKGNIVSIEILNSSRQMPQSAEVEYEVP